MSYFQPERTKWFNYRLGAREPAPSFVKADLDLFFAEMGEAGIDLSVALGRNSPSKGANNPLGEIPNEHIAHLQNTYPDKVVGIAGIDVGNELHDSLEETRRSIRDLGLRGIHLEPARSKFRGMPDDKRIYPLYELCVELDIPVVFMTGPFAGDNLEFTHPKYIQTVAADFPSLDIVCGHGCYPFVTEVISVAFKHTNVYISADVYTLLPGGHEYVEAGNTFLQDQMLFGTAYPVRPLVQTVEDYRRLGITDEAWQKLVRDNARRVLRLPD